MSLLWPESVSVGLFPGDAWVRHKKLATDRSYRFEPSLNPNALLNAAGALLDDCRETLPKNGRLNFTVSDSAAAFMPLAWQENLHRPEELGRYAQICFEKAGFEVNDDWQLHTEFPTYRQMGMAYAMPKLWLGSLIELTVAKGFRVHKVLPLSAAILLRQRSGNRQHAGLTILRESSRVSAITAGVAGFLSYDVEPVTGSAQDAVARLLRRVVRVDDPAMPVAFWSSEPPETAGSIDYIRELLPQAAVKLLSRSGLK